MSTYPSNIILNFQSGVAYEGFNGIQNCICYTACCKKSLDTVRYKNEGSTTTLWESAALLDKDTDISAYPCNIGANWKPLQMILLTKFVNFKNSIKYLGHSNFWLYRSKIFVQGLSFRYLLKILLY